MRECAGSWVTYFKQRRVQEYRKKQTLETLKAQGAQSVGELGGVGVDAAAGSERSTVIPSAVAAAAKVSEKE